MCDSETPRGYSREVIEAVALILDAEFDCFVGIGDLEIV